MKLYSTNHLCKNFFSFFIAALIGCCNLFSASAQVTIPSLNDNDSTARPPLGCFYGYERTEALYLSSEIGSNDYITQVAFYVNSVNAAASSTPVVIKMKTTASTSISADTYDNASTGATTVWSGNITSSMLSADSWITITLTTPFNYASNNLAVFVETNFGSFGGENWDSKGIRQSGTSFNSNQYWENDVTAPTDLGELSTSRPNIQLTLGHLCSGTPNPGNTISDAIGNAVCSNVPFTLSLQNISAGAGLTYKWKSSPTGATWTTISGATNSTYTHSQTSATYYHCVVTCTNGGGADTSSNLHVTMQSFYHCYCASYAITTEDTKIDSVTIGTVHTGSDPYQCESYTDYTGAGTATLSPGTPSTIHIVNGSCTGEEYEAYVAVFIDLNHNTSFTDAGEMVYSYGPIYDLNSIPDGTFFIPTTATSGTTGMRIVLQEGTTVPLSCGTYTRGETEDYLVSLTAVTACSGIPNVGSMNSTLYSVCPNEHFTLSLDNYLSQSGLTYQWQYSTDQSIWNNGGTSFTWTDSQTVAHYFRLKLTCSGNIGYSDTVLIAMNPFYQCYCSSYSTAVLGNDTKIDTVQFGTINAGSDPSHCESYTDNTNLTTDLPRGLSTNIHIVNGSCDQQFYESYVAVYIDTDHVNGFESDELMFSYHVTGGLNSIPLSGIDIPDSTTLGMTGMRVIIEEGDLIPSPCELYQFGETEDYTVNIVEGTTCTDPPTPGTTVASPTSVCANTLPITITLSLSGNSSGTGQTYQWEQSTDGVNYDPIAGQTNPTGSATIDSGAITYYRCQVHCGATTLPSTPATVTVNAAPVGDTYDTAIPITLLPYQDNNNNLSSNCYTIDYAGEFAQPSPDVFYTVTTPIALGSLTVSTCATTDLNTVIHILGVDTFTNDDNGNMCLLSVEASDSFYVGLPSQIFYIVVQGQGTLEGNYQLNVNFIVGTGANQIQNSSTEISLFPNPNNGTFDLSFDLKQNINDVALVSITNVIGQVIDEEKIAVVNGKLSKEISLTNQDADGLYFVSIRVNDLSLNERFILQR